MGKNMKHASSNSIPQTIPPPPPQEPPPLKRTPGGHPGPHHPRSAVPRPSGPTFPGTPRPPPRTAGHAPRSPSGIPRPAPRRSPRTTRTGPGAGDATPPPQGSSSRPAGTATGAGSSRPPASPRSPPTPRRPAARPPRGRPGGSPRRCTGRSRSPSPEPPSRTSASPPAAPPPGPAPPPTPHPHLPAPPPPPRLQVHPPHHTVLRRVQREVHHLHRARLVPQRLPRRLTDAALVAQRRPPDAAEPAPPYHLLRRKDRGERAHRRRLPRPLLPAQQNPADRRVHRVDQEPLLQKLLPHQCAERKMNPHFSPFPRPPPAPTPPPPPAGQKAPHRMRK